MFVDRLPLKFSETRPLQHRSLIQAGDFIAFFLLPNEQTERRKRHLKERRKQILAVLGSGQEKEMKDRQGAVRGQGKRVNLSEVLQLWEGCRKEVHSILGESYSNQQQAK